MAPLEGIRVVEVGVWVAGPSAAGILADWGADVVKVEPPSGDPMRNMFTALGYRPDMPNPPFALDNRGKRSLVLDLRQPPDRAVFERLLARADVFVTNLRPGALERLNLDPRSVSERHPRLVYASLTGYGLTGNDRDRPGYDIGAFWARPGIARQAVASDEPPASLPAGFGDHVTGVATVAGILAALWERERTGKGGVVETSLLRTGMYTMGWELGIQLVFGKLAPKTRRDESPTPLVNCYRAGDERWFFLIGLEGDRHFPGVCRAIGRPDLAEDPRFATARDRRRNSREFIALLDATFATRTLADWTARFDREDVWWAPAQSLAEVVTDPQAVAAGGFVDVDDGHGGTFLAVNSPVHFGGPTDACRPPVPELGQHTEEVLAELAEPPVPSSDPPP
jgi:crotonobetainyl-CoA:carnitine CoA-transferase CaiB-like acyl-CoA transferase